MGSDARIACSDEAVALFAPRLRGRPFEQFCVAHLGAGRRLLRIDQITEDHRERVAVPLRALFGHALAAGAEALILAHNHPSGDPGPSRSDLLVTRQLVAIARPLGLTVLDHLIFADDGVTSFRALGLL